MTTTTTSNAISFGKHVICSDTSVLFYNQATCDAFMMIMEDYEYTNWIIHAEELLAEYADEINVECVDWWAIANVINETNESLNYIVKW